VGGEHFARPPIEFVRPSPTAGQAALEYIAVISLVTALLLLAAPAVGAPSLAGSVARGIRIGVCVVVDDICTREEAVSAGLPPCQLRSKTRGYEESVTVFSVDVGSKDELTGYRESDGSVSLVWTGGVSIGLSGGLGLGLPFVDAGAHAKLAVARGWRFPDAAAARRFIAEMPRSALDQKHWPALWHTVESGRDLAAALSVQLPWVDLASLGISAQDALGARMTRGGGVTLYYRPSFDGPEATLPFIPSTGRGEASLMAELSLDDEGPSQLTLRQVLPADHGNRLTESVARLNLHDPVNRALLPWTRLASDPRGVVKDVVRHGTVEHNVYSVNDTSRSAAGELAIGIKVGASGTLVNVERALVDATARTPGSDKQRSRFDCLDQLR
jgi:hypothetical protein